LTSAVVVSIFKHTADSDRLWWGCGSAGSGRGTASACCTRGLWGLGRGRGWRL